MLGGGWWGAGGLGGGGVEWVVGVGQGDLGLLRIIGLVGKIHKKKNNFTSLLLTGLLTGVSR